MFVFSMTIIDAYLREFVFECEEINNIFVMTNVVIILTKRARFELAHRLFAFYSHGCLSIRIF